LVKKHTILCTGIKAYLLESTEVIDEIIIHRVGESEIEVESLKLTPGERIEFAFIQHKDPEKEGWRMLFEDPFTGKRCYSQRAPTYVIKSVV
jgi:hypothetical protein